MIIPSENNIKRFNMTKYEKSNYIEKNIQLGKKLFTCIIDHGDFSCAESVSPSLYTISQAQSHKLISF